jgi:hypothetical protein
VPYVPYGTYGLAGSPLSFIDQIDQAVNRFPHHLTHAADAPVHPFFGGQAGEAVILVIVDLEGMPFHDGAYGPYEAYSPYGANGFRRGSPLLAGHGEQMLGRWAVGPAPVQRHLVVALAWRIVG